MNTERRANSRASRWRQIAASGLAWIASVQSAGRWLTRHRLALGALVLWVLAIAAGAVQFIPWSIEELAAKADLVVHGKVLRRTTQRDDDGRIFTRVEFQVLEVFKGKADGECVTLVHGGGVLGQEESAVSGQVEYAVGEEAVVFAVANPRRQLVTIGLCQGKFKVWQEHPAGQKLAANGFTHGAPQSASPANLRAASPARQVLSLAELKDRVQARRP